MTAPAPQSQPEMESDEFAFAHEGYCNASRKLPVGGDGCSCRAGREIKMLQRHYEDMKSDYLRRHEDACNYWMALKLAEIALTNSNLTDSERASASLVHVRRALATSLEQSGSGK